MVLRRRFGCRCRRLGRVGERRGAVGLGATSAARPRSSGVPAVRFALLFAASLVAFGGTADAESRLIPLALPPDAAPGGLASPASFAGPVVAGDRVVWAVRTPKGAVTVRVAESDGRTVDILRLRADRSDYGAISLEAAGARVALARSGERCSDLDCRYLFPVTEDVWSGVVGEPLARLEGCGTPGPSCRTEETRCRGGATSLSPTHYASSTCRGLELRELASATTRRFEDEHEPRLAGRYLASIRNPASRAEPPELRVRDLQADALAYRVELARSDVPHPNRVAVHLQADAKVVLAWFDGQRRRIAWASPAEPVLHAVDAPGEPGGLARDLVAYRRFGGVLQPQSEVGLVGLDGRIAARFTFTAPFGGLSYGLAWDGERLAWAQRPCETVFIAVVDLARAEPPPSPSGAPCPRAKIVTRKPVRVDRAGRFSVTLSCPAEPALGCAGTLRLVASAPGRAGRRRGAGSDGRFSLAFLGYAIQPGGSQRLPVRLSRGGLAFVRTAKRPTVQATAVAYTRADATDEVMPAVAVGRFALRWRPA